MAKVLIAYYSRGGVTRKIAQHVQKELGCDIEEIADRKNRKGIWGFITGALDARKARLTQIGDPVRDPSAYDLVILGTPVWASTITPAIRTYIAKNRAVLKKCAFIVTAGGSVGGTQGAAALEQVAGAPAAMLAVCSGDVKDGSMVSKVKAFVASVKTG